VSLRNEPIFSLGALYSERVNVATGRRVATFSVITTAANPLMETIHNFKKRMPLIIPAELEADWLAPSSSMEDVLPLVVPFPDVEMLAWQVNPILSRGRAVNAYSSTVAINGLSLF
jgi:putative SOS response-associated peptidase YedK